MFEVKLIRYLEYIILKKNTLKLNLPHLMNKKLLKKTKKINVHVKHNL